MEGNDETKETTAANKNTATTNIEDLETNPNEEPATSMTKAKMYIDDRDNAPDNITVAKNVKGAHTRSNQYGDTPAQPEAREPTKRKNEGEDVPTVEMTDSSPIENSTTNITENANIAKKMDEGVYNMHPNNDNASVEVAEEVDCRPDTGVNDNPATDGGPDEEPVEGVDDKIHDGKQTPSQYLNRNTT